MSYSEKDFKNCVFNPMVKGRMLQEYTQLDAIIDPVWHANGHLDKIIRYVVACYDDKSPLVIQERDMNYRKGLAAELAGFDLNEEELMASVYDFSHEIVLGVTIGYLRRFAKSKHFAALVALETSFWESLRLLLKPIKDQDVKDKEILDAVTKKAAIKNEIDSDITRLDAYYSKFFGEDADLEKRARGMRPEDYAKLNQSK